MSIPTPDCPVCTGPPIRRIVWLRTLSMAEKRRRQAWYGQVCTACGLALGLHQAYRHPHTANSYGTHCVGFCGATTVETEVRSPR